MIKVASHLSCLVLSVLICIPALTQFRVGVTGGGAVSSVLYSSRVQVDQAQASHYDVQKSRNTYFGGVVLPLKVGNKFIVRPGIFYFKKAWEVEAYDKGRVTTQRFLRRYDINYIHLPVNLLLTTPIANGKVYVGAGPYIAYATNGSVKVDKEIFDLEFKKFDEPVFTYLPGESYKPIQFINHYTINRIDYGVNGVVGYEFPMGLFVEAGVDIGAQEVSTSLERFDLQWNRTIRDPSTNVKYSIFRLGAGWLF